MVGRGCWLGPVFLPVANSAQDFVAEQAVAEGVEVNVDQVVEFACDAARDDFVALAQMNFNAAWICA
jgi:hypothetical protein